MNNVNQYNIVKNVLDLEVTIRDSTNELNKLSRQTFRECPAPPVMQMVDRVYPPPVITVRYRWYIMLLPIILFLLSPLVGIIFGAHGGAIFLVVAVSSIFIWTPGYIIVQFIRRRRQKKNILKSKKYKSQVDEYDRMYDYQQQQLNQQYAYELSIYNNQVLPQYNNEKRMWTEQQERKIAETKTILASSKAQLKSLYDSSRIIPSHYRNIDALQHICMTLYSANYDVSFAINSYDNHRMKLALDEANQLKEQLKLQEELNSQLLSEHNDRLDETNDLIRSIRNDQRIIGAVGAIQNARSNHFLKGLSGG